MNRNTKDGEERVCVCVCVCDRGGDGGEGGNREGSYTRLKGADEEEGGEGGSGRTGACPQTSKRTSARTCELEKRNVKAKRKKTKVQQHRTQRVLETEKEGTARNEPRRRV